MLINIRPYVNEWDKVERSMTRRPKVGESWENSQYALYGRRLCQMNDTASSNARSALSTRSKHCSMSVIRSMSVIFCYCIFDFITSTTSTSAGSHFTPSNSSLVSHFAASCSFRCKESVISEQR